MPDSVRTETTFMSMTTNYRTWLTAILAFVTLPAWSQSYRHAPPRPSSNDLLLPTILPVDWSPFGNTQPLSPMPTRLPTQSSAPLWTPASSWSPSDSGWPTSSSSLPMPIANGSSSEISYEMFPSTASFPSTFATGMRPLPSRLHSSAFVHKRPTYRPATAPTGQQHTMPPPAAPPAPQMMQRPSAGPYLPAPDSVSQMLPPPAPPAPAQSRQPMTAAGHSLAFPHSAGGSAQPAAAPNGRYAVSSPTPVPQRAPASTPTSPTPTVRQTDGASRGPMTKEEMAQYARSREAAGDWPAAIAAYDALIQFEPGDTQWRVRRAECAYHAGRFDLAVADYTSAAVAIRLSFDEFVRFGDAALRVGDYVTAERALAALSQVTDQPMPQVELLRGIALLRQGKTRDARNVLLRASGRWPDNTELTDALRMASAAHYGNQPLPDLAERRRARKPQSAQQPIVNVTGPVASPERSLEVPANAANWRATQKLPADNWTATKRSTAPASEESSQTATILEASAEVVASDGEDAFAAVRPPTTESVPAEPVRQWRATSHESP